MGKIFEAQRLKMRTEYDLEILQETGYVTGIENYVRYFNEVGPGGRPPTLMDFFPEDFLMVVDESHMSIPQIGGMFNGNFSRKQSLVEYGFRLPSAFDNRPLKFEEFEQYMRQAIFVSATPGAYEMERRQALVEQIIRPTGLVDPEVIVLPVTPQRDELGEKTYPGQIQDLLERVKPVLARNERVLVTTLTKKMAQDLTDFMKEKGLKVQYLHSDIETIERLDILAAFRKGEYDIVIGVNLLREGLDIPEVSLVAILDADKEGFLRSETSLIQTIGRAARNVLGSVILYADRVTGSMQRAMTETERRRTKQVAYNTLHGITPRTIRKKLEDLSEILGLESKSDRVKNILALEQAPDAHRLDQVIKQKAKEMKEAAKNLQFELAAILRDEIGILEREVKKQEKGTPLPDAEAKKVRAKRALRHGRTR
jgi:excinuclease ABC subunit B